MAHKPTWLSCCCMPRNLGLCFTTWPKRWAGLTQPFRFPAPSISLKKAARHVNIGPPIVFTHQNQTKGSTYSFSFQETRLPCTSAANLNRNRRNRIVRPDKNRISNRILALGSVSGSCRIKSLRFYCRYLVTKRTGTQ